MLLRGCPDVLIVHIRRSGILDECTAFFVPRNNFFDFYAKTARQSTLRNNLRIRCCEIWIVDSFKDSLKWLYVTEWTPQEPLQMIREDVYLLVSRRSEYSKKQLKLTVHV